MLRAPSSKSYPRAALPQALNLKAHRCVPIESDDGSRVATSPTPTISRCILPACDADPSRATLGDQARDHRQHGGLAAAGVSQDRHGLTRDDAGVDVRDRRHGPHQPAGWHGYRPADAARWVVTYPTYVDNGIIVVGLPAGASSTEAGVAAWRHHATQDRRHRLGRSHEDRQLPEGDCRGDHHQRGSNVSAVTTADTSSAP